MQLVVCRYNESIDWVNYVPRSVAVRVYNKGELLNPSQFHGVEIINLPNIGRETQTWFHHLIFGNWMEFDHVIFMQGDPRPHTGEFGDEIVRQLMVQKSVTPTPLSYAPISNMEIVCDADGEPHHPGLPMARAWQALWPDKPVPAEFKGFAGGQFLISTLALNQYPITFYQRANQFCLEEPLAAWAFERLWHTIWTEALK